MKPSNKPWLIGGLGFLVLILYIITPNRKEFFANKQSLQKIIEELEYRRWQRQSSRRQFQLESALLDDETSAFNYDPGAQGLQGRNPFMEMQRRYRAGQGGDAAQQLEASLSRDPSQYRAWATFNRNYNPTFNKDLQLTNADRELDKIIHSRRSGGSSGYNRQTWGQGTSQWGRQGSVNQQGNTMLQGSAQSGTYGSRRNGGWWNQGTGANTEQGLSGPQQQGTSGAFATNPSSRSWNAQYSYGYGNTQYSNRMTDGDRILDSVIHNSNRSS